jgi:superfamily II DNA/RNA helicase
VLCCAVQHRIGRTGRMGNAGRAITFLNDNDRDIARDLARILVDAKQPVPPFLQKMAGGGSGHTGPRPAAEFGASDIREAQIEYRSQGKNDRRNRGGGGGAGRGTQHTTSTHKCVICDM